MGRHGVPEDHASFGIEVPENAVHDRARGLFPGSGSATRPAIGLAPAQHVELAGEGDPRPAHALVAGGFADGEDVSTFTLVEVMTQVGQPDGRRSRDVVGPSIAKLIESRANGGTRQVLEEGVNGGGLVTIGQCSSPC